MLLTISKRLISTFKFRSLKCCNVFLSTIASPTSLRIHRWNKIDKHSLQILVVLLAAANWCVFCVNLNLVIPDMGEYITPQEKQIKVGNYNINYVQVGKGPHHVFCMPGALGTVWTDFKPQVEGLNKDLFTIVAWDPVGYGKSRPPEKEFTPDYFEKDADIAAQFLQQINIRKFSILGWSDGGISGMILAAKYPSLVNKLVIWGSSAFVLPHEIEALKKIRDVNLWSNKMRQPMVDVYGKEKFAEYWSGWVDRMVAISETNNGNICSELVKNIICPTLILHGEKDPLVDDVHVSHLHTNIEGSRIHLYPDGKHNIHIRYADDFNKRVQEFLLLP